MVIGKRVLAISFVLVFVALLIPSALAISSDLRENYGPGETIVTKIQGNILGSIEGEQVKFRRGHVAVPLDSGLEKLGGEYYIWAIAPEKEEMYNLVIEDLVTTLEGKVVEIDFEQNFSVGGNGSVEYNVKPGVIFAREDFSLTVFSFVDTDLEINVNYLGEGIKILKPGENKIDFSIDNVEESRFLEIGVGDYVIPAYIIGENSVREKVVLLPEFRFKPRVIESRVIAGTERIYPFQIINAGEERIILDLDYNEDLFLVEPLFEEITIESNGIYEFNATLKGEIDEEINEIIYARSGNFSIELPINIGLTEILDEVETPYLEDDFAETVLYYCPELNGIQCTAGETCSGEIEQTLDGSCCLASCEASDDDGGNAWIGWLIGGIIVLIIVIVFVKYRRTRVSGKQKFDEKVKSAESKGKVKLP